MRNLIWPISIFAVSVILASCSSSEKTVKLTHIHGLGYSHDGKQALIPAHDGIVVYENGGWSSGPGDARDYMGFNMVDEGFYSSGHPAEGSDEKNPLGIVKSNDGGITIDKLDLYGAEDFHLMAVGYQNHAIFVFTSRPNPRMNLPGLYFSNDDAKTWTRSEMNGVPGDAMALAAHTEDENKIALVTSSGLFLSNDRGETFNQFPAQFPVTAVTFDHTGELMIGGQGSIIIKGKSTKSSS